jgi:carbon-monoxide dehydrogenase medium subunit
VIPPAFDYVRPGNLAEALRILGEREGSAKLLSGGFSLIPLLKLRLAQPEVLVDLRDVGGLDEISRDGDTIRIGSRVTHRQIQVDAGLGGLLPIMREAASGIGDPQVRNWGTIGGSVAHADPASDWPAVLVGLRASLVLTSAGGERIVPARGFFLDPFVTGIEPTEILREVRIPVPGARTGSAYRKLERRAGDFSTVGSAVSLSLGEDGRISHVGIGLTAVSDAAFAATHAEDAIRGSHPSDAMFREAAEAVARQSRPVTDAHGPAEYKRAMAAEMTRRALEAALERAQAA